MEIVRPTDLAEALAALAAWPDAVPLAGGTDVMVDVNLHHLRPARVVALRRIDELASWEDGWLGAGVTYARMLSARNAGLPALAELARTVGSPQIRAVGSLGGNLATASPAGDTLPFLAALDATIVLASSTGKRRLRWDDFFVGPKVTARRPGELIVGVGLPAERPDRQAFAKVGLRRAMAIATVNCCVVRDHEGATRVALGAVAPTVIRARRAEAMISAESRITPAGLEEFARLVGREVRPISDHRGTAAYRRHAAQVVARRTLERCLTGDAA